MSTIRPFMKWHFGNGLLIKAKRALFLENVFLHTICAYILGRTAWVVKSFGSFSWVFVSRFLNNPHMHMSTSYPLCKTRDYWYLVPRLMVRDPLNQTLKKGRPFFIKIYRGRWLTFSSKTWMETFQVSFAIRVRLDLLRFT